MDLFSKFKNVKILVAGDVMLDRFWWGDVTRISPEAPVPVVHLNKTSLAAGGAANVAANISTLGATPYLLGCVGTDPEASELSEVISSTGIATDGLIRISSRKTTVKTRILAHGQQIARVDQETAVPLGVEDTEELINVFERLLSSVNAIVLSDYAKGCLSTKAIAHIISSAKERSIPVIVDPKGRDFSRYRGATILTPNRREAAIACNIDDTGRTIVESAGKKLLGELDLSALLVTEGPDGMTLFEADRRAVDLPATAREVYDSTGAGDTVIAALAVSLAAGFSVYQAATIANTAAGLAVEKLGTATVSIAEVSAAFESITHQTA